MPIIYLLNDTIYGSTYIGIAYEALHKVVRLARQVWVYITCCLSDFVFLSSSISTSSYLCGFESKIRV